MKKALAISTLLLLLGVPARAEVVTLLCIWSCSNCNGADVKIVYKVDMQAHTINDGSSTYRAKISERYIKWTNGHEFQIDRVTGDIFNEYGSLRWNGSCQTAANKF
jgi:hypothetical protein